MKGIFIVIVVILALILGGFGFWYYQRNSYSKESLKLELLGPTEAGLAEEIEYLVKFKNNGNIRLESARLTFEYPHSAVPLEDETASEENLRREKELDDIYPGEERSFSFKARLLGKENEAAVAKAWLSYQPKNLKARYESSTTLTTMIKNVPLTFEFDLPSKAGPTDEIRFRLNYFSNIDYPLSDLRVQIDYPKEFEFKESTPQALEKSEWEIPVLNRADGGRIEVLGQLKGKVGEEKTFRARIGTWRANEFILLKEVTRMVALVEPSLYIVQQINANPEYVANVGDQLHFEISFKNIGNNPLTNLFLISRLGGKMIDFETLKAPQGKFEPGDNSIVFDWRQVPALQFLDVREEGKVEFWVELKESWDISDPETKNPIIKNEVILGQAQKEFVTRINSKLEIVQKGYFQDEVFGNSGPNPPKVGEVTTYTIMWQAKNYSSEVKNARVKAILPAEVRLTGEIFPEEQKSKFAFESQSREMVWELGDLEAGKGVTGPGPNIAFQIAFAPVPSQQGQVATLVNEAQITGDDGWSGQTIKVSASSVDTTLPDDSSITDKTGKVQ